MIEIKFNDKEFTDLLRKIAKQTSNSKSLMAFYFGEVHAEVMRNFRQQGSYGDLLSGTPSTDFKRWPPLGKFQMARRAKQGTGRTAMLQQTNRLRLSIGTVRKVTNTEMQIGTDLIYSAVMHFGAQGKNAIRPRKAKWLTIPFPGVDKPAREYSDTFVIFPLTGGNPIMFQKLPSGGFLPLFTLVKKVEIPPRPYLTVGTATLDRFMNYAWDWLVTGVK
jgi:phage gpG-like protein